MNQTFRSLRHRDYRLWAGGAIVSNTGTWMQRVAQDWLVIQVLTHGSGTAGGITTGLQFGPILLLAPVAGTIADRFPQRRTLMATQAAMGFLGLVLAALVLSGHVQLWHVYVLATLLGCASAIDGPATHLFLFLSFNRQPRDPVQCRAHAGRAGLRLEERSHGVASSPCHPLTVSPCHALVASLKSQASSL